MLVPAKALDLFLLLLAASKLRQRCNPTQGLDAAHPRYGAAAALLSGGLRHARSKPPHGDDAAGVARAVTIDGEACVVTERCAASLGGLRRRWGLGRSLAALGRSGPGAALAAQVDGGSRGAARRGNVFLLSRDGRFVFKQEDPAVLAALEGGLAEAYARRAAARGSLLPRLVGAYTVERGGETTHWLATTNVFGCRPGGCVAVRDKYDVKGSTAGRRTRPRSGTLKDLDALDDADALRVRGSERVLAALEADTALLADLGLLDYSLLLGVMETPTRGPLRPLRRVLGAPLRAVGSLAFRRRAANRGVAVLRAARRDGSFLVVGLIDILQPWTWAKKLEFLCRGALRGYGAISAVPPATYRARFLAFAGDLLGGAR